MTMETHDFKRSVAAALRAHGIDAAPSPALIAAMQAIENAREDYRRTGRGGGRLHSDLANLETRASALRAEISRSRAAAAVAKASAAMGLIPDAPADTSAAKIADLAAIEEDIGATRRAIEEIPRLLQPFERLIKAAKGDYEQMYWQFAAEVSELGSPARLKFALAKAGVDKLVNV